MRYWVSFTPAVSKQECMASWGRPMSTVFRDRWELEMLPRVDPPAISERLENCCTGTSALRHRAVKTAWDAPSVA